MSHTSFRTAFDCLPAAARAAAHDVPKNVRAQVFAPNSGQQLDVWAMLGGDAGSLPGLDGFVAGQAHGASQTRSTIEPGDGPIQCGEGGFLHAPILDRKTIAESLSISNIPGMTIHNRIRVGREAMKLTAQEFADRLGVTRGAVQQWEKPQGTAPSRKHQGAVAALLGITIPELMNPNPNPGEILADKAQPPRPDEPQMPMSENARVLGVLFDMLPNDVVMRAEAYNAASAEIIAVLQGRPRRRSPEPTGTPEQQMNPEKQRA